MIISVFGDVDTGKSSLISRILINTKVIKSNEITKAMNNSKNWLSNLIDTDQIEQERGITITPTKEKFYLNERQFQLINTPGHHILSHEIIKFAYQADIGLLLISAQPNHIDQSIKIGYVYALINRVMGVNHLIICINKSEFLNNNNKYDDIILKIKKKFRNIKFNTIYILPLSAKLNLNIERNDSTNCDKCLFDILKSINIHRRESRIIKPIDNKIKCKLFFYKVDQLVSVGYIGILHSGDKIFTAEFTRINNKLGVITKRSNEMIDCELKIETNDHLDYGIILKNNITNTILAYGIIY